MQHRRLIGLPLKHFRALKNLCFNPDISAVVTEVKQQRGVVGCGTFCGDGIETFV